MGEFTDFTFAGESASDYGLTVCCLSNSGSGFESVSIGSTLNFNTVKAVGNKQFNLYGTSYDEVYTTTFQVGKYSCTDGMSIITPEECSQIARWLNRNDKFYEFRTNYEGAEGIRYFGSFNLQSIKLGDDIYGFELTFTTDSPFAYDEKRKFNLTGKKFNIYDVSDEIGEIYPLVKITIKEAGDLTITNTLDDETLQIKNCEADEIITLDNEHKIITSSVSSHKVGNDFNYNWFKIINTYNERRNVYNSSLNIQINVEYSPVRKVGV